MANDTLVETGPVFQQVPLGQMVVTPPGGTQTQLQNLINGGTLAENGLLTQFSSITPAGTLLAGAVAVTSMTTQLGAAASTTGVKLPLASTLVGITPPLLLLNTGTAAITVYGQGGDTIDGTAGTTGVALTNARRSFFTPVASGAWISGPSGLVSS